MVPFSSRKELPQNHLTFYNVQQKQFLKHKICSYFCPVHSDALHAEMLTDISEPKGVFLKNKIKSFLCASVDFRCLQDFDSLTCIVFLVY